MDSPALSLRLLVRWSDPFGAATTRMKTRGLPLMHGFVAVQAHGIVIVESMRRFRQIKLVTFPRCCRKSLCYKSLGEVGEWLKPTVC